MDRPENRTTNTAGSRVIRATNRTANHGRRVAPVAMARMNRGDAGTTMDHGAMSAAAVAAAVGCIRVRVEVLGGAVRAVSASGR